MDRRRLPHRSETRGGNGPRLSCRISIREPLSDQVLAGLGKAKLAPQGGALAITAAHRQCHQRGQDQGGTRGMPSCSPEPMTRSCPSGGRRTLPSNRPRMQQSETCPHTWTGMWHRKCWEAGTVAVVGRRIPLHHSLMREGSGCPRRSSSPRQGQGGTYGTPICQHGRKSTKEGTQFKQGGCNQEKVGRSESVAAHVLAGAKEVPTGMVGMVPVQSEYAAPFPVTTQVV